MALRKAGVQQWLVKRRRRQCS